MAKSGTWEEVVVRGKEAPLPFKGVSGAGIGGKAYFFGGYGGGYSDETHIVDASDPRGLVHVLFADSSSANAAALALHGRWFGGRAITCAHTDPAQYNYQSLP